MTCLVFIAWGRPSRGWSIASQPRASSPPQKLTQAGVKRRLRSPRVVQLVWPRKRFRQFNRQTMSPFRSWNSREQQKVGAVAVSTGGVLPEAVDSGCAEGASLSQGAAKEALGPFPKDVVMGQGDLGEGGKEDAFALPLPLSTRKSGGCDDEDAPLFCRVTPVGRRGAVG
ncbi:hypothetical protein TcCL_ESM04598 [Trypanosoma cruzi]|nr:hypothetical protein TcCL_ESM04598 [Trypanosoma cruzi]